MLKERHGRNPKNRISQSLNPYFNGTCSKSKDDPTAAAATQRLNPYFNGTCSKSLYTTDGKRVSQQTVLILILMEHAQRVWRVGIQGGKAVLILILMEHAQRDGILFKDDPTAASLNPYFNGTCSKRTSKVITARLEQGLNPYFNGTCSKSY